MFSVVNYGRVFARAVANTIAQGDIDHLPVVSSLPSRFTSRLLRTRSSTG